MEANVKVLTIADLIKGGRPHTGASSLSSRQNASSSSTSPSNSNPKILTPLRHPAILIGTLSLPNLHDNCLQFSDNSSQICCDILGFSVRAIGKKIHVIAWNFIPLKRGNGNCNGYLEIIKWKFPDSECSSSTGEFDSVPLASTPDRRVDSSSSKSSYKVHGALESISPVSTVPCSTTPGSSLTDLTNLRGFLMQFLACECKLCSSKDSVVTNGRHEYTKTVFLYFSGVASCWHPVMVKLVGTLLTISGLKNKLVFMGKERQLMLVNTERTVLHVPRLLKRSVPVSKTFVRGNGECGEYSGVVKGVYMQGMVVELESDVWLLLTGNSLMVPHSLRAGTLMSVRNVHFINPRFRWTKILILGACSKTSIAVESFSPLEVGCYRNCMMDSLLGKFIDSLSFSSRFWALLVVSSFRKKFSGILSEKEILGSKHKKGLAHMYISSHLPSPLIQAQPGVFMEFCKHKSCCYDNKADCGNLKLAVPISSFFYYCEAKCRELLAQGDNKNHTSCEKNCSAFFSCEAKSTGCSKWRIFPSVDASIVLLGSLKISPSSGRLQLVDMTGSIDVIVPDLLSTWNADSIYEVVDYAIAVHGIPQMVDPLHLLDDPFSCRSIFNFAPQPRKGNLSMFVYFHLNNSSNKNHPPSPCMDKTNHFKELEGGKFHVIQVTHKFPFLQKFQVDPRIASRNVMFVEAIVLPWDLVIDGESGTRHPTRVLRDQLMEPMEYCSHEYNRRHYPAKKHKTVCSSIRALNSNITGDADESEAHKVSLLESGNDQTCTNLRYCQFACSAMVRSDNDHYYIKMGKLCSTKANVKTCIDFQNLTTEKVLLEFDTENSCKCQPLQVGQCYIIKHFVDDPFCDVKDSNDDGSVKLQITLRTNIWNLTFSSDGLIDDWLSHDSPLSDSSGTYRVMAVNQVAPPLKVSGSSVRTWSAVHLHLSSDAMTILKVSLKEFGEDFRRTYASAEVSSSMSNELDDSNCLFREGNLVSFRGDVVAVHGINHNSDHLLASYENLADDLQLRSFQEQARNFCIHILVDRQPVTVFGSLSEHAYLIGFGPGVDATFHRILKIGDPTRLMLTPVSLIVINSIRLVNEPLRGKWSNLQSDLDVKRDGRDNVSSGLISELIECTYSKQMCVRCRVVAILVLVLEKKNINDNVHSDACSLTHLVDIPLAGIILDDGSSSFCCWANAERAATLLRLHEELPQGALTNSRWTLKWEGIGNSSWSSTMYHIERILDKHGRITVVNYGSMADSSYQDFSISLGSENTLNSSDEDLLKFISYHACLGRSLTVVARIMDTAAVQKLRGEHLAEIELPPHSMQDVSASEVYYTNSTTEARNALQELLDRQEEYSFRH